ncbi:hypothetical protein DRF68_08985 [Candidatus Chryseobacterium massiliae]|uniref:Uncharacterized protein n=1 Tax=Candidatus Chryseobacterium massiliense TaxID=204089 RepID=A0A3D9BAZ5_9FLAO|nr:hypothetical protein DRF68_08985 [Candidatus Chryseobacterium massiliae]
MKKLIYLVLFIIISKFNAQPFPPPSIKISINKNDLLSDDFINRYLMNINEVNDKEKIIKSEFYTYK